jgi:hypothetical protein
MDVIQEAGSTLDPSVLAKLNKPTLLSNEELEANRQRALRLFQTGYAVDMSAFDVDEDDPTEVPAIRQVFTVAPSLLISCLCVPRESSRPPRM